VCRGFESCQDRLPNSAETSLLSPELNLVERWFQEFRRTLAYRVFETVGSLQDALARVLERYWKEPARLRSLTGLSWWTEAIDTLCHQ
jgi:hypothetical protein